MCIPRSPCEVGAGAETLEKQPRQEHRREPWGGKRVDLEPSGFPAVGGVWRNRAGASEREGEL